MSKMEEIKETIGKNEIVQKVKNNKYYKWIKIGVVLIIVILVASFMFGGNKVENDYVDMETKHLKYDIGCVDIDIDADVIGESEDGKYFLLDVEVEYELTGQDCEHKYFKIVHYNDDDELVEHRSFEYTDENKDMIKEMAEGNLIRFS